MSEEIVNTEKFIIRMLEHSIDTYIEGTKVTKVELTTEQAQGILDLYNKQKERANKYERYFKLAVEDMQLEGYMLMPYNEVEKYYSQRKDEILLEDLIKGVNNE